MAFQSSAVPEETSGFHVHAIHVCLHICMSTQAYPYTPLMLTPNGPLKTTFHTPKASTASPNLAMLSHESTCLVSLPLPTPIRGESPCQASHPVASPGRINFQLTTGGWPGVSAWPEPRQTGCGIRADYHMRGRGCGGGGGWTLMVDTFTVAGSLNRPGGVLGGLGQTSRSSCLPASCFLLPTSCILLFGVVCTMLHLPRLPSQNKHRHP